MPPRTTAWTSPFRALLLVMAAGCLLLPPTAAATPPVTADASFWATNGTVKAVAPTGNGSVLLGGSFDYVGPITGGGAGLATADARLTLSRRVNGTVRAAVSDGFGGIFIGGEFTAVDGQPRTNLAHITSANVLGSWRPGTNGPVLSLVTNGVAVWVGGSFSEVTAVVSGTPQTYARTNLAQVLVADGSVTTFVCNTDGAVRALGLFTSTLVVGGDYSNIGGSARQGLSVVGANTAAVLHPVANVVNTDGTTGSVRSFAIIGTTIYIGGKFDRIKDVLGTPTDRQNIASFDGGALTLYPWNPGANGTVEAVTTDGSTIWAGGHFDVTGGATRTKLAAYTASVTTANPLLSTWNPAVLHNTSTPSVTALAVIGGRVYIGGSFTHVTDLTRANERTNLMAVGATDAVPVTTWLPRAGGPVRVIAPTGSSVYVGGQFTSVGGFRRDNLAELSLADGALTAWSPTANGAVEDIAVHGPVAYVGGAFTSVGGAPRVHLAALSTTTGAATTWKADTDGPVDALAVTPDGVYVGGAFTQVTQTASSPRAGLARVTHAGALDAWAPDVAGGTVQALALPPFRDRLYVGGSFTTLAGQARARLGAFSTATGALTSWAPSVTGTVRALAATTDTAYAGGTFSAVGGVPLTNLAAIGAASGAAVGGFAPDPNGTVEALALSPTALYAAGSFSSISGQPRTRLAGLNGTTGAVTDWAPSPGGPGNHAVATLNEDVVAGAAVGTPDTNDRGVFAYRGATSSGTGGLLLRCGGASADCFELRASDPYAWGPLTANADHESAEQGLELITNAARGLRVRTDASDGRLREWTGSAYGTATLTERLRAAGRLETDATWDGVTFTPLSSSAVGLVPSIQASDCTTIPETCGGRKLEVKFKQRVRYADQLLIGRSYRTEVTYEVVAPF